MFHPTSHYLYQLISHYNCKFIFYDAMFYKCVQKLTQTIHLKLRQIKEINYEGEEILFVYYQCIQKLRQIMHLKF